MLVAPRRMEEAPRLVGGMRTTSDGTSGTVCFQENMEAVHDWVSGLALWFGGLFFFLFDEIGDGLCALKASNGSDAFGDDACIGVQLLRAFYSDESSSSFFKKSHDLLLFGCRYWGICPGEQGSFASLAPMKRPFELISWGGDQASVQIPRRVVGKLLCTSEVAIPAAKVV